MMIVLIRLTIFFFNVVTACIPAFTATFGPKLGLRAMTNSRFSWGWYGAKIVAFLNCIACVGWSIVNTIAGAQTLESVADYKISAAAGTVIIALITLFLGMFGYKWVHRFEQFAWVPSAIAFLALLGVSAKDFVSTPMAAGQAEAASVLSFGGIIFSFTIGWASLSSDYNVYMPADSKKGKIFGWTYLGLIIPLLLVEWLGAAVASAALASETDWYDAYEAHELGGLLGAVFSEWTSK
jgi:purine-cytosine permease-like protein